MPNLYLTVNQVLNTLGSEHPTLSIEQGDLTGVDIKNKTDVLISMCYVRIIILYGTRDAVKVGYITKHNLKIQ